MSWRTCVVIKQIQSNPSSVSIKFNIKSSLSTLESRVIFRIKNTDCRIQWVNIVIRIFNFRIQGVNLGINIFDFRIQYGNYIIQRMNVDIKIFNFGIHVFDFESKVSTFVSTVLMLSWTMSIFHTNRSRKSRNNWAQRRFTTCSQHSKKCGEASSLND